MEKLNPIPELHLAEINATRNSYIKKEDFLDMIKNLNFDTVNEADITFNTGYMWDNKNEYVKTYRYTINIS